MTTTIKLTNSKALGMILEIEEVKNNKELFDKITTLKAQLEKKNKGTSKKETAHKVENENLKIELMSVLEKYNEPKSIKELQTENESISITKYSNQKISALLRQLIKEEIIVRVEEKRVAKFKLV